MRDWTTIRERFLRDNVPVRLGGLAANLRRIYSFAGHDANSSSVAGLLDESKFFIEWTARETSMETAAELVELQVLIACWQREWVRIWSDPARRREVAEGARVWSDRVLNLSGLLGT